MEKIKRTSVTRLVEKLKNNNDFINLISELKNNIVQEKLGKPNKHMSWVINNKLYALYGQFIDYFIRHYVSSKNGLNTCIKKIHTCIYYKLVKIFKIVSHIFRNFNIN